MPKEHGGAGIGISAAAMVMRSIGKLGSAAVSSVHLNLFGPQPVVVFGTEVQKRRMLPPLIVGTDRACFGVTEYRDGSHATVREIDFSYSPIEGRRLSARDRGSNP